MNVGLVCSNCGSEALIWREYENLEPHGERHTDVGWLCVDCGAFDDVEELEEVEEDD